MKKLSLAILLAAAVCTPAAPQPTSRVDYYETDPAFLNNGEAYRQLGRVLRYPSTAVRNRQEGQAVVTFILTREGKVTDVQIAQTSRYYSLDDEALRAVKTLGPFKPTIRNGTDSVTTAFMIPILFRLNPNNLGDATLPILEFPAADIEASLNRVEVAPSPF